MSGVIERLYVLNAGFAVAPDQSIYAPGLLEPEPVVLSCNAYLIRRDREWILWDTGIPDEVAKSPGGQVIAHNIRGIVVRTIKAQLADLGLTAEDVSKVILSHGHFDHIGNARMFSHAEWFIQRNEYVAMIGPDSQSYGYDSRFYDLLCSAKVNLLDGDHDLFADRSVKVISTPGHTLGHCSLLIRLKNTGPTLLSGDVAHHRFNMERRCVPAMNADPAATRTSMERVAQVVKQERATLWINHDIVQSATIQHSPAFFE